MTAALNAPLLNWCNFKAACHVSLRYMRWTLDSMDVAWLVSCCRAITYHGAMACHTGTHWQEATV
jgi:hypothetical protein